MGLQIWSYYKFSPGSNIVIFHDLAEWFGNWPLEDFLAEIPTVRLSGSWALVSGSSSICIFTDAVQFWFGFNLVPCNTFPFTIIFMSPIFTTPLECHYWFCPFVLALHVSLGKQPLSVSVGLHEHVCMSFSWFSHIKNGISRTMSRFARMAQAFATFLFVPLDLISRLVFSV